MIRADNAALRTALPQDPAGRVYMASPFTVYPTRELAWRDACRSAAALQACTAMAVYSPISDSYGLEAVGKATLTHAEWMLRDRTMLLACQLVAVAMLPGWETSKGIAQEIEWAHEAGIPVVYLQPVGQHDSGAYVIGSMDAGPPEGIAALTLFHQDLMREAWTAPMREDPYAGETVLGDVAAAEPGPPLPDAPAPRVPMEPAIPDAPGTLGGGAF